MNFENFTSRSFSIADFSSAPTFHDSLKVIQSSTNSVSSNKNVQSFMTTLPSMNNGDDSSTKNHSSYLPYQALASMAEYFRRTDPPQIRMTVHCLKAALSLGLPALVEARVQLQLGRLLMQYAQWDSPRNQEAVKGFLDRSLSLSTQFSHPYDAISVYALDVMADFFLKQRKITQTIYILNEGLKRSENHPFWRCKFLFKLVFRHIMNQDVISACELLDSGTNYCELRQSTYMACLFLCTKAMLLLSSHQLVDFTATQERVRMVVLNARNAVAPLNLKPYHRCFIHAMSLIFDVMAALADGKAKTVKTSLKELQDLTLSIVQQDEVLDREFPNLLDIEYFMWLPKEFVVIITYLLTISQSIQVGVLTRAQKYVGRTITHMENIASLPPIQNASTLISHFEMSVLEHLVTCRIITGAKTDAVSDINNLAFFTNSLEQEVFSGRSDLPVSYVFHIKQRLHCILGLYCMAMNCMEQAAKQFNLVKTLIIQQISPKDPSRISPASLLSNPIYSFVDLSLSLVFLRQGKVSESHHLLLQLNSHIPEHIGLRTALFYARGFQALFTPDNSPEAEILLPNELALKATSLNQMSGAITTPFLASRLNLRETLKMANEEDFMRITVSALISLGYAYMCATDFNEAKGMIETANNLAKAVPDISVQLWATALLKDVFHFFKDSEEEARWYKEHDLLSQKVINDHVGAAGKPEHHRLIEYQGGPVPVVNMPNSLEGNL